MTLRIALAAGGTGGHLFPAVALARELVGRGHAVSVLTDPRGAAFDAGIRVRSVPATRLAGGMKAKLGGGFNLVAGILAAVWHLRRDRIGLLVGFGGYPSVGPVLAARLLGVPVLLHEQNAVLGRANARLARFARLIATSFPDVERIGSRPVRLTGNPVRAEAVAARAVPYEPSAQDATFRLLVFGGSQGASIFADVLPAACALLPGTLRKRLRVTQQARTADMERTVAAYSNHGIEVEVAPFFRDLPDQMARCHLVIARSGASTIAELMTIGRPSVLVPYPHAMDDHQTVNARAIDNAGGAWLMPQTAFTPESLARRLETLLTLPACAARVAQVAHSLGRPDAASQLADAAESVFKGKQPALRGALRSLTS
jgi:UDP-N-acetylglucosamine--N-acetylmuramyl-(pentapeptide) pyrophosphoryl-undecaprenol N-acetylglucosamine transferase